MARTKTVYPTNEIPHLWAHKTQSEARSPQRNLYFENEKIFSYGRHYEIARHVTTKHGNAILFNCESNSVTTNSHRSLVRSSIPSTVPIFTVPELTGNSVSSRMHMKSLAYYNREIESHLLTAARAKSSYNKEWHHQLASEITRERNDYVKFFSLRNKPLKPVPALDSKELEVMKAKEKARVKVETAKAKQAQAERLERAAQAIKNWRTGGDSFGIPYDAPTMLRVNGSELETSRGARIPMSHAKRALVLIQAVVERGEDWIANGHTCHVGHYKIDRIEANGTIKAGCHVILRDEWERVAPQVEAYTGTFSLFSL